MVYKLYVVFHKYIIDNSYINDPYFDINNFIFFKCNEKFEGKYNKDIYKVKYEKDLEIYNSKLQDLEKPYMAVSALYHIYKNEVYKNLDYIGFMEYDLCLEPDPTLIKQNPDVKEIQDMKNIKSMTKEIHKYMKENERLIILLSARYRFNDFFSEENIIEGRNFYYRVFDDFNKYYNTNHKVEDILKENPVLGDQQSFLADKKTFELLMGFISYLVESKRAEVPGFRPSYLLARYIGMSLHLLNIPTKLLSLKHLSKHEW